MTGRWFFVAFLAVSGCVHRPVSPRIAIPPPVTVDPFISTIEILKHAVVPIVCMEMAGPGLARLIDIEGTAFFISPRVFLTAGHVIEGIRPAVVAHSDGSTHACALKAVYIPRHGWRPGEQARFRWLAFSVNQCQVSTAPDVAWCPLREDAVFPTEDYSFPVIPAKLEAAVQPDGTAVAFTGFPLRSNDPLTSRASVGGYLRSSFTGGPFEMMVDTAVWPGASGSPIYLSDGRVVGIVVKRGTGEGTGRTIAVPTIFIDDFLSRTGFRRDE